MLGNWLTTPGRPEVTTGARVRGLWRDQPFEGTVTSVFRGKPDNDGVHPLEMVAVAIDGTITTPAGRTLKALSLSTPTGLANLVVIDA